jgi:predicted flap endonuclease-1-like 5' DNA nuclease
MEGTEERHGSSGRGLLLIGVLALARAWWLSAPAPDPRALGERIPLEVEALAGEDFRLLPGVGPVLAERLERARVAAGGRLAPADLSRVSGVGPSLRARWAALRTR